MSNRTVLTEEPPAPAGLEIEWAEWLNMRKAKGKIHYPTPYGQKLALDKLKKYSGGGLETGRFIINKAIEHNWDGFFPLNEYDEQELRQQARKTSSIEVEP